MTRLFLLIACLLFTAPAIAQDSADGASTDMQYLDSTYFTLDDGVMTRDEMEEEARYVHRLCAMTPMQNRYYNCDCVAGGFLVSREKLGPMVPQSDIYQTVMNDKSLNCVNPPAIADQSYRNCLDFVNTHRETSTDGEGYCTCVANRTAREFSRAPLFDTMYATSVEFNAMNWCDDPANRPKPARRAAIGNPR